ETGRRLRCLCGPKQVLFPNSGLDNGQWCFRQQVVPCRFDYACRDQIALRSRHLAMFVRELLTFAIELLVKLGKLHSAEIGCNQVEFSRLASSEPWASHQDCGAMTNPSDCQSL